jgi:hypothetical protein
MAIWSIIAAPFTALVTAAKESYGLYMKKKIAKVEGEIRIQERVITGDIDYNVWAQRASQTSWKDEWLTLWTTAVVTAMFFPQTQVYVISGFEALNTSTPEWFAYCFVGMYVAVFGLKGWKMIRG